MATCDICGERPRTTAPRLHVCANCIRAGRPGWEAAVARAHARARGPFGLPARPPRDGVGAACDRCVNTCRIAESESGYCGVRRNEGGVLLGGGPDGARVDWYHDSLPTNCVGDWVCSGGTGAGHPAYAHSDGPEYGYTNLAVFYRACSFDCLFCQNWHFRHGSDETRSAAELAAAVTRRTACICYFGGDPTPQLPHALETSWMARDQNRDRILRICWETNGSMSPPLLDQMIDLSLESGGCIKFDLKAFSDPLHIALTGVTNRRTLANFRRAAAFRSRRPDPPLLIASTLLVPGYVDAREVHGLAGMIANIDPDIPYSLLAFAPQFEMSDLPCTSRAQAEECLAAASEAGLTRVRVGNRQLLR